MGIHPEIGHTDISVTRDQLGGPDTGHGNQVAFQGKFKGRRLILPDDGDEDLFIPGSAHAVHRFPQCHAFGGFPIDLDDDVTGINAGVIGRGSFNGRHHRQNPVLECDHDTDP